MARSLGAHLAHTQSFRYFELKVNGRAIGEFGQFAMCASEIGVRSIFGSGDLAFTKEADDLVPGIETVAVKRGLQSLPGDELPREEYGLWNTSAIHLSPVRARERIKMGAIRAVERYDKDDFGLIFMEPPYERVTIFRPEGELPWRIARETCDTFVGLMNTPYGENPMDGPPANA
jgi:D-aminopeptidase